MTIRPWSSTSASAPPRKNPLTIAPRAVRRRSSGRGNARRSSLTHGILAAPAAAAAGSFAAPLPALIVSYASHAGGAERILADHATAIGDDVIAACPEGWLAERLREQRVRVFSLKERPLELRGQRAAAAMRLAAHGREVRELVEALRPHTVVAWGMRAALAYAALLPRFAEPNPRFVFQHNDLLPSLGVARAVRAAASRADLVLALSDAIAEDLAVEGVEVIHPGVDLERFSPGRDPGGHALFLGAITPWKRPDLAIKAAHEAGIRLVVAGAPL